MPTSKTWLISPDAPYAFSNLLALAMTQSLMGGSVSCISNGPSSDGGGVLFKRIQGLLHTKFLITLISVRYDGNNVNLY